MDYYFNRKLAIVQWIVTFSSVIILIGSIFSCYKGMTICIESNLSLKLCLLSNYHHYTGVLRSFFIIFGFRWSFLNKYFTLISNFRLDQDHELVGYINKTKRLKSILLFTSFTSYSSILLTLSIGSLDKLVSLLLLALQMLNIIVWLHLLSIITDLCINLQSVFKFINGQIVRLHEMSLSDYRPNSSLKYELKIYRYHYSLGIHMMKAADRYARVYITWLYTEYAIYSISQIFATLLLEFDLFIRTMFNITNAIIVCYLTFNLINVNTQSNSILEELYEISFHSYDLTFRQEIDFCLYRLSKRNVGFTYGNIFVITPNFITSLATITLTIVLAIPNLMKLGG